ncbi:MAG: nucleotidyltransferase family protein [Sulfolobales archaeon]
MKAAIIAGGLGKRLRPLTEDRPKPLVEVAGKPIIEWQIEWLKQCGVSSFVVLAGYYREKLIDFLGSGSRFGVHVAYVIEDEPLGTGGAIKNAESVIGSDTFIAVNGDVVTNIPVGELVKYLNDLRDAVAAIALVPLRSPYGIVELDRTGRVVSFREKPVLEEYLINAGVYVMKPEIFEYLPSKGDVERDTFPKLAAEGRLAGRVFRGYYWRSIDTIKDVEEASHEISRHLRS